MFTLSIELDPYSLDPRKENDNLGTMVCLHRKYDLGDKHPGDLFMELAEQDYILLPLYLYDHSGITVSTKPFSCPFDSGQVGYIYAKKGSEGLTDEQIVTNLEAEVKDYNAYLTGQVFGYVIKDEEENVIDSCWGFTDEDYCKSEGQASLEYYQGLALEKAARELEASRPDMYGG